MPSATPTPTPTLAPPAAPLHVDVCNRIDSNEVAKLLSRKLIAMRPLSESDLFGSGCQYDFGTDADGKAYYVNLMVASEASFAQIQAMSGAVTPLKGLGDDAYTAIRPDSPQLWVLVKGTGSVGVAIGGAWSVDRAQSLATMLIGLLNSIS